MSCCTPPGLLLRALDRDADTLRHNENAELRAGAVEDVRAEQTVVVEVDVDLRGLTGGHQRHAVIRRDSVIRVRAGREMRLNRRPRRDVAEATPDQLAAHGVAETNLAADRQRVVVQLDAERLEVPGDVRGPREVLRRNDIRQDRLPLRQAREVGERGLGHAVETRVLRHEVGRLPLLQRLVPHERLAILRHEAAVVVGRAGDVRRRADRTLRCQQAQMEVRIERRTGRDHLVSDAGAAFLHRDGLGRDGDVRCLAGRPGRAGLHRDEVAARPHVDESADPPRLALVGLVERVLNRDQF
ncbi:hypothetical protein Henu3_gp69 [Mycobacterium phage Henu3]|uniref:Uncharacterized protein n=1 Tax=Mycobacterium phage Henu3 TaxID=2492961 RepID=A0A410T7R1_9CAUD|nr:hypothetical protein I5G68_gp63 [Mycobacterium phage Henu3]QAU05008.1 hypothetical protein Henu3_gp69 [Mycobacterium phage Henu3]